MNLKQRKRNWPLYFEITKPTRFDPGGLKTYWADEWEALQKSRQPAQTNDQAPNGSAQGKDQPAQANAESPQAIAVPADATAEPATDLANTAAAIATVPLGNVAANPEDNVAPEPCTEWSRAERVVCAPVESAGPRTELCRTNPPDFARHARRCAVCSHPDRDAIEGDFIRWRSPELIAKE